MITVDVNKMIKGPLPHIFNPLGKFSKPESNHFRGAPLPRPQLKNSFLSQACKTEKVCFLPYGDKLHSELLQSINQSFILTRYVKELKKIRSKYERV